MWHFILPSDPGGALQIRFGPRGSGTLSAGLRGGGGAVRIASGAARNSPQAQPWRRFVPPAPPGSDVPPFSLQVLREHGAGGAGAEDQH